MTAAFASASSPETKTVWSPPASWPGSTMRLVLIVFSVFTTRASGKRRWIRSPSESVLHTKSDGGMP